MIRIPGRYLSVGSIGVLTALAVAFGAWSGFSGPPVAEVQLRVAAENLAASTSLVEVANQTDGVIGTAEQAQLREVIDFHAPNRESTSLTARSSTSDGQAASTETLIQIGSSCWIHSTGPSPVALGCSLEGHELSLEVLKDLESSTGVKDVGGTYFLTPQQSTKVIAAGSSGQIASVGMATFEVRISGDTISWERLSFDAGESDGSILINDVITFTDIDHAPPVVAPAGAPTATAAG